MQQDRAFDDHLTGDPASRGVVFFGFGLPRSGIASENSHPRHEEKQVTRLLVED